MPFPKIITCYTTIADKKSAKNLITQLLESRLIACGVTWPANSQYHWEQEQLSDEEYVLYMKSSVEIKDLLMTRLLEFHPYDVPCILIQEVECNQTYYIWVNAQTGQ